MTSRKDKKPILALVTLNSFNETFRDAITPLVQADAVRDLIKNRFIFSGFSLSHPPLEQLAQIISLGNSQAALYFIVVQHDAKV